MIFVILIFALILRLINLNQSLWLDEAVQAITAQKSFGYIFQEITGDFHPPLYHFLLHFWVRIFGSSEISLRTPSVLFGVGTVYTIYLIAKKVFPQFHCSLFFIHCSFPDLTALLVATAPFHIYYSQEARMYSLTCFLAVLSMFYFIKIFSEGISGQRPTSSKLQFKVQNFDYLWYFLATICLIYSDYYGFLILLAQGIYLLIKKKYKFLILSSLFIILCYLPWLPILMAQIKTGILATQTLPEWGKLVNLSFWKVLPLTFVKFSLGRLTIFDRRIYSLVILGILGGLGLLGIRVIREIRKEKGDWGKIILTWLAVPLTISWLLSIFVPNYQPFRLLLVLPAFYLLLAEGIVRLHSPILRCIGVGLVIAINLVSLGVYYFNPYFHREDWRGVTKFLASKADSSAVLPSSASNWPIRYYDPEGKIKLIEGTGGVREIREMGEIGKIEGSEVYYIRYLVPLFDPDELILEKFHEQGYTKTREISFNQIPVWEYRLLEQK